MEEEIRFILNDLYGLYSVKKIGGIKRGTFIHVIFTNGNELVVGIKLSPPFQPLKPDYLCVWDGRKDVNDPRKKNSYWANILLSQSDSIPLFIKDNTRQGLWKYQGNCICDKMIKEIPGKKEKITRSDYNLIGYVVIKGKSD